MHDEDPGEGRVSDFDCEFLLPLQWDIRIEANMYYSPTETAATGTSARVPRRSRGKRFNSLHDVVFNLTCICYEEILMSYERLLFLGS